MKRRQFVIGVAGVAVAWPLMGYAQDQSVRRIGILSGSASTDADARADLDAFKQAGATVGWTVGQNVAIDERWAGGSIAHAAALARELIGLKPDVILTAGLAPTRAVRGQTKTIPIIFARVSDPVGQKLVESLSNPGGNVTGFTNFEVGIGSKWLQILKEIAPEVSRVGVLGQPGTSAFDAYFRLIAQAAPQFSVTPVPRAVHTVDEMTTVVADAGSKPGSALIVLPDGFTSAHRAAVISAVARYRLPAIYPLRPFAAEGGLLSYGVNTREQFRQAASYVDRIFKGTKVDHLPVQEPTKFELVVNAKTAKALGLSVPQSLLLEADEVIE